MNYTNHTIPFEWAKGLYEDGHYSVFGRRALQFVRKERWHLVFDVVYSEDMFPGHHIFSINVPATEMQEWDEDQVIEVWDARPVELVKWLRNQP